MNYDVFGGFPLPRNDKRLGDYDRSFWKKVDEAKPRLSRACGCYVFALKHGDNFKAWYVGKAERQPFYKECFSPAKRLIFNDILIENYGTAMLFFIPRMTSGNRFCRPTMWRFGYGDVEFLETMLIGIALKENAELANVRKTKYLREMRVPGVINSRQAPPTRPVRDLRNALGLSGQGNRI